MAQGTYKPDANSVDPNGSGDRDATFMLINGVGFYGGFPSGGGTWIEHDPHTYETILSGDINTPGDTNDNSYHVVTGSGVDPNAIIDGFTITGGNANGGSSPDERGGGIYNVIGSPTLINCTFTNNLASTFGAGMYNSGGEPNITDCTFTSNSVLGDLGSGGPYSGGGMNNGFSSPTVTNCTFSGNSAAGEGVQYGGGAIFSSVGRPTLTSCTFTANTADKGGAICNVTPPMVSSPPQTLVDCTFSGNSAAGAGGAIYDGSTYTGEMTLIDCTFSGNSATEGGGMCFRPHGYGTTATLTNCTFSGNAAGEGGGVWVSTRAVEVGMLTLTNCILWGNSDVAGSDESTQIFADPNGVVVTYSCIQGCSTWYCSDPNNQNIGGDPNDNPLFVRDPNDGGDGWADDPNTPEDEAANDDYGDLRLTAGSICIDVGNNDADTDPITPEIDRLPDTDLDGRLRIADGDCNDTNIVDMGAYEFTYAYIGDFDSQCDVDFVDYAILANYWLTDELLVDIAPTPAGDGIIDKRDLGILCENWLFGK